MLQSTQYLQLFSLTKLTKQYEILPNINIHFYDTVLQPFFAEHSVFVFLPAKNSSLIPSM